MAGEILGHIGNKGNFYCRKCHTGGCDLDKETNQVYHSYLWYDTLVIFFMGH